MVKMSNTVSRGSHILNYYEDCDKITTLSDDFMTIYDWYNSVTLKRFKISYPNDFRCFASYRKYWEDVVSLQQMTKNDVFSSTVR